jgi:haloalkane dehalogenase
MCCRTCSHEAAASPPTCSAWDSDKLPDSGPGSYRFVEHRRHLDALDVHERVTFVAMTGVRLSVSSEPTATARPRRVSPTWRRRASADLGPLGQMNMRPVLKVLRSEAGDAMVLRDNFFVEQILPLAVLRTLSAKEMAEYRRPFAEPARGDGRR